MRYECLAAGATFSEGQRSFGLAFQALSDERVQR
jgi:hypothetical protein